MSRLRHCCILALFPVLLSAAPADRSLTQPTAAPLASDNAPHYPFRGVILGVYPEKGTLLIKHEDVPGLMKGMKMAFRVDPAVCKQVKEGETITATLVVRDDDFWLEDVKSVSTKKKS